MPAPEPLLPHTTDAERNGALAVSALHLFGALVVPILVQDLDGTPPVGVWIFTSVELLLCAVGVFVFGSKATARWSVTFARLRTFELVASALNYALLPWVGVDHLMDSPARYLLTTVLLAFTAIASANSANLRRRRSTFLGAIAVVGASHMLAFAVAGELIFAVFTLLWCVAIAVCSRIGFETMQEMVALRLQEQTVGQGDLTGLLTRSAFVGELERRTALEPASVLVLIDLDGFKAIYDRFGHSAGDVALNSVVERCRATFPPGTALGRLGGDEFGAIVPTDRIDLQMTLERVTEEIGAAVLVEDRHLYLAVSLGWTELEPTTGAPELMAEADAAMYATKSSSTVSITGFGPEMREELDRSLELRQRFRTAIKEQRIEFLAQPIVRASDRGPIAVELLARWPASDDVVIGPDEFNRLADETGLAVELDRLALTQAQQLLHAWRHDPFLANVVIKANVSPLHLHNLVLARSIRELIPDGDRSRLGLEFVETKLIAASERHHALLRELKSMGVTISVDDFGTGYSSLAYLRALPVSEIKIDRSFITGIDDDRVNQGLVRAIVDLASALGLHTVAEGVESSAEWQAVVDLGVHAVQGFLTGRPLPLEQVEEALKELGRAVRGTPAVAGDGSPISPETS